MKTTITLKTSLSLLFLFSSILLFGQKRYSLSLQIKQGITGIEKDQNWMLGSSEYSDIAIPGGDFSIGIDNDFFFLRKKYLSGSAGVLWNYNSFTKKEEVNTFNIPLGETFGFERIFRFTSHSIIFPISLNSQIKKIGFSVGVIPRYNLSTKMREERLYSSDISRENYLVQSIIYEAGKSNPSSPFNRGYGVDVFLQTKMDVQFLVGVNYFLSEKLSFELEYKNIIDANYLRVKSVYISDIYSNDRSYNFNSKAITVGMSWRMF